MENKKQISMQNNQWGKYLAALLIVPAAGAVAQQNEVITYNWYLNGGAGLAQSRASTSDIDHRFQRAGLDAAVTAFDDTDLGYGVALGYQWHDNWAVEAGLRNLGEFAIDITAESENARELYNTIQNLHPESAKGIFAALNYRLLFGEKWSASAKLGLLNWRGDYDTHLIETEARHVGSQEQRGTDIFFGIASSHHWTPRWESQLGWERYQFGNHDVDFVYLGLLYRFGERYQNSSQASMVQTSRAEPQQVPAPKPTPPETMNNDECRMFSGSLTGLNFASNSAELMATAKEHLQAAVEVLHKYPTVKIQVLAHTDSLGTEDANRILSDARANAVRNYFILQGINAARVTATGFGEAIPLQDNSTPTGRAVNRRVELKLLNPAPCDNS